MLGFPLPALRPSAAPRWSKCPASFQFEAAAKQEDALAALEGELVHKISADCLLNGSSAPSIATFLSNWTEGEINYNPEMDNAVTMYVEHVRSIAAFGIDLSGIEQKIKIPHIHELCEGTPDAWVYCFKENTLHIWDLKFGWLLVEAEKNPQCLCYAIGVTAQLFKYKQIDFSSLIIRFHIVQPRPYHPDGKIRTWSISFQELQHYRTFLADQAQLAYSDEPPVCAGTQCYYCGAYLSCFTSYKATMWAVDAGFFYVPDEMNNLFLGSIIRLLQIAKAEIDHKLTALEASAIQKIRQGEFVPSFAVENGQGRRVWSKTDEEMKQIGKLVGVNMVETEKISTPHQAEKGKKLSKEVVAAFSHKQLGSLRLVDFGQSLAVKAFKKKGEKT